MFARIARILTPSHVSNLLATPGRWQGRRKRIKNLKENADVYKSVHGESVYNNLLVSLISKMTGGGSTTTNTNSVGTPTSVFALSSGENTMLDEDDNDEDE